MGNTLDGYEIGRVALLKLSSNTIGASLEVGMAICAKAYKPLSHLFLDKASLMQRQLHNDCREVFHPIAVHHANQAQ